MTTTGTTFTHQFHAADSLPYQELVQAANCQHRRRNLAGECRDMIGCGDGAIPLDCDCHSCDLSDITRRITVNPFSRDLVTIATATAGQVEGCQVIACYNRGNGRECWLIVMPDGRRFYEFPNRATAERLASEGGRVAATHAMRFC